MPSHDNNRKFFEQKILSDVSNEGRWHIFPLRLENVFLMNACAVKALNLFAAKKHRASEEKRKNRFSSLSGLLGLTKTAMGALRLDQMIRQPLIEIEKIGIPNFPFWLKNILIKKERRLDIVELFLENGAERREIMVF